MHKTAKVFGRGHRSRTLLNLLGRFYLTLYMLSRSCFSATMASRFEIVDEEYIEELKDKIENENTKNSTEYWKYYFKNECKSFIRFPNARKHL